MVRYAGKPQPPYDRHAVSFQSLNQVVWSIVGARGASQQRERADVLDLAARFPNITGAIEGMVFLGSPICDLDLEAVEWTRRWINQVQTVWSG